MFEQMKRTAALFAVGALFSSGAWAADAKLELTAEETKKIASEFFGETREVTKGKTPTKLTLTITGASAGSTGDLTVWLEGATFAGTVSLSDFAPDKAEVALVSGGAEGDSSVVIGVTTATTDEAKIVYTVPNLDVKPVAIAFDQTRRPTRFGAKVKMSMRPTNNKGEPGGPLPNVTPKTTTLVSDIIDTTSPALNASTTPGGTADVSLAGPKPNLKVFAVGEAVEGSKAKGLLVGGVAVSFNSGLEDLTGNPLDETSKGFGGDLDVAVNGAFGPDDSLTFGGKKLEISGNSATGAIAIADVGTSSTPVIYIPGGQVDLRPSTITAQFRLDFDDAKSADRLVDKPAPATRGTIRFAGIRKEAYAYAVVKPNGAAVSYVRATCKGAGGCKVFADCNDQVGNRYFGELGMIGFGQTQVFNSNQIGEAVGGGWDTGRGRCDLYSSGGMAVQHLINQGGTLVNNSVVIGSSIIGVSATGTTTPVTAHRRIGIIDQ